MTGVAALVVVVLAPGQAFGLDPDKGLDRCALERFAAKDGGNAGLPGDSVRAVAQANDGQLWVATFGGLARYDGVRFTRIEAPPALRLAVSDVEQMLAARDGSLWLGSLHHPPVRVQQGVLAGLDESHGLPAGQHALAFAEQAGGQIWMATEAGIYRYADGRFIPHATGLGGRTPTQLRVDDRGTVWLGTDRGLHTLVGDRLVPHPAVPTSDRVSALYEDRRHVMWVAAGDSVLALAQDQEEGPERGAGPARDHGTGIIRFGARQGLPPGPFAAITDDADGNVWLGTRRGLARLRGDKVSLFTTVDGLAENDVSALLADREGTLWVGSRSSGLLQVSDRTLDTSHTPALLAGRELESVCEAPDGAMWFGSRGGGAVRVKDGVAERYGRGQGLPNESVDAVLPAAGGAMWLGTTHGLYRWRPNPGGRGGTIEDPKLWPGQVIALHTDRQGALWIGGMGELGRLDPDGRLTAFGARDGVPARHVRHFAEDAAGRMWLTGIQGGVLSWQGQGFSRPPMLNAVGLRGPVRSMLLDPRGVLWLSAERDGLVRLEGERMRLYDVGLPGSLLYQLLEDDAGDIWLGTHNSIVRVSRSSLDAVAAGQRGKVDAISFETLDRRTGVVAAELKQPSAWKTRDGRLWFVSAQSVVTIDPRRVRSNGVRPTVAVEGAVIDGRPAELGADLRVPAGAHRVELHFAGRALLQPSKVRYRYRLEGVDADWVEAGTRRLAVYGNGGGGSLPAGAHRFQVVASNNDGLWSERPATVRMLVAAPFYRSYTFYLSCLLGALPIGLSVVFFLHRMHLARVRAEYAAMFAERNRVARELHDTLLQGMSAVGMQLNAIRGQLGDAPASTRQDLALVQDTVAQCLEETRRVVWDLRRDAGPRGDLAAALARSAERLCQPAGLRCEVNVEHGPGPAVRLPPTVEDQLFRIAEEALTNAAKHAGKQAGGTQVIVRLQHAADAVTLSVTDDGPGFDPGVVPADGHFGLTGMRERAAAIDATLVVRSAPGQGTTVEVTAPVRTARKPGK